ncbi:unnamed protein product [Boreogadus saida]
MYAPSITTSKDQEVEGMGLEEVERERGVRCRHQEVERGRDQEVERRRDQEVERRRDQEVERGVRWKDQEVERGRDQEVERRRDQEVERRRDQEVERVDRRNRDLVLLTLGALRSRRRPPATQETRREAWQSYLDIIYHMDQGADMLDLRDLLCSPGPPHDPPPPLPLHSLPPSLCSSLPPSLPSLPPLPPLRAKPTAQALAPRPVLGWQPKPGPAERPDVSHTEEEELPLRDDEDEEERIREEAPCPSPPPSPPSPPPPPPPPPVKRRTDPHQSERRPDPVPTRPPSPRVPDFLLQFAEESWFKHLYPQPPCVPTSLSPDGFCWVLLDHLDSPGSRSKREVLVALKTLLLQHLLQEQHAIAQHLLLSLPRHTGQALVGEMLTIALQLGGGGYSDVINLLVLLANQTPSLCQAAGARLEVLGVQGAETWLRPELQSWGRALRGRAPAWRVQQDRAARWLSLWTTKYKDHVRVDQRGHASSVNVLNFFCSSRRARQGAPGARHDTVRLSPPPCGPQPIHRLGETHSMLRTRKAAGLALPPLRNRPSLTGFPRVLSFPLPRLNLLPLSCPIGQLDATPPSRRYFLLDQSQPEYYR